MNKRFGYILGGMGALAACVLLILAGVRVWLGTDTAQRLVQEKISNAIPGTVEWKDLDFSVFAGKAELHGLLLKGPDGDTLIAADRVLANVALTDLFRRKITIETAELDHPQIFLETDPEGQLNLMRAFPASDKAEKTSQGSPPDILIREAKITDGFFRFAKTGEKPEHVTLEHIDLTAADGDVFRPEGRAMLRIGSGDVDMAGIRTRLDKFETNAALKSAQLSPLNLTLETGFGLLTLSGTVDDVLTVPRLDLKLALDTALENIRNALSLPAELDGAAKIRLSVTGAVNDPDALLTLNYGGGNLAGNPVDRLDLDCALTQRRLTFNRLDVDAPAGSATLTGTVSLEKYFPGGFLSPPADLNAIAYDLALNLKQLAFDKPPLEKTGMGGTASGTLTLSGIGVLPEQLAANAKLDLNAEKFALGKAIAPSDIELSADVKLVENRASVSALDLKTRKAGLQVSGEYDLASRNADAKLKLDASDMALMLTAFGVKGLTGKAVLDADISGPAVQPDISARLSGNSLKFNAITIGNLKLDALLNQAGTVKISSLDLKNQGSALQAKGTLRLFEKGWKFISDMPADLDLAFQNVEADDFVKNNDFKGTITGSLAVKGPLLRPDAVLKFDGKKLAFQSTRIGDVETALQLAAGTLAVDHLKLRNARSGLNLSGTARVLDAKTGKPLDNPGFDLKLSDTVIFPADFTDALAGKIVLNAGLHGTLKAPAADISLSAEKLEAGKNRIGDLDAALGFAGGNLNIRQMKLRNRTSGLNLSGTVALLDPDTLKPLADPRLNLKLADTALHLRDFGDDFRGDLNLSADITGTAKNPKAALSVDGKKLEFSGNRVGDVNAAARFADGTLFLEPVEVTNRKSGLKITGTAKVLDSATLKPLEDPAFDLAVSGDALYLNDFVKDMKGKLSLNAKIGGTLGHPAGRLSLDGKRLDFGVQKIAGIHLDSRLDGERVNIESFLVAMGKGEEIVTDGWVWPRKKQYDLRMKTDGISLRRINALKDSAVGDGKISFSIAGNGTFENPRLEGDITVGSLKINRKTIEDLRLKVDVQDYIARISGNADFNLDAQYHLKTKDFSATARFDNTDLTPWLMIAGMEAVSGAVSGKLTASGNADNADGIKAAADFSRLELSTGKTGLVRTENFTASFEKGRIHLPKLRLALLDKGYLDIGGTGEMAGAMDFRADGLIPLEVIRPFATDLNDITGTLKLSASAGGTFKKPEIRADVDLEKIGLTVPGLLQKLHDLNGKIRLTPSEIVLDAVRGNLDTGTFALSGTAALKDFQPDKISAKFTADALPVKVPDMLDLLLSTNLSLDGTIRKSALKGEVTLLDGSYYKDVEINLLEGIGQKKREESPVTAGKPDPFLDHMALDITVRHRNPFTVDNNMALLTIKPDLRVYGTASVPLVSGRAEVDSGTITYQNKEFEVKKGVVDFLNPYKIEPTLDIESDVTIRSWVVTLTVSGTPDALKLKLSSSPHEEDGDILSLLTIGKTTRELIAGEGGTSRSPKQMLADIAATQLKGRLKDATGLDIVELEYNEKSGDETGDEVRVTVGKELSRRMTVKYGVESKNGETVQKAVAEYKFLEKLLMRTFQDTGGNFGGELVYRLEFR